MIKMANVDRNISIDFGPRIKDIRLEKGITVKQAAKVSGMSCAYWSLIENQYRNIPSLDQLANMAKALKISQHDIFMIAGFDEVDDNDITNAIDNNPYTIYHGKMIRSHDINIIKAVLSGY